MQEKCLMNPSIIGGLNPRQIRNRKQLLQHIEKPPVETIPNAEKLSVSSPKIRNKAKIPSLTIYIFGQRKKRGKDAKRTIHTCNEQSKNEIQNVVILHELTPEGINIQK